MKPATTRFDNPRLTAVRVLAQVLGEGRSLATALPPSLARTADRDRSLVQALCYGTLRWQPHLDALLNRLLERPLKTREHQVRALLLSALYQILHLRAPDYAVVSQTVAAARSLGKPWAAGLANAVLRGFLRRREALLANLAEDLAAHHAHPAWLLEQLQQDWPQDWEAIAAAANHHPPLTLRVNLTRLDRADYLARLAAVGLVAAPVPHAPAAVVLEQPLEVERLPGFAEGLVSVQDAGAQLAAELLDPRPGLAVLDACAAPGGKTGHILERQPKLARVLALDVDANRLARVGDNLRRLGLGAELCAGDGLEPARWWDGRPFDRILLDAPCSATGVIRRHPDIKVLRAATDIPTLAARQQSLLEALWPLLAPSGRLVYATCSVLRAENEAVVGAFLNRHPDAQEQPIAATWGRAVSHGRQVLPGEHTMDGFYYACLAKHSEP